MGSGPKSVATTASDNIQSSSEVCLCLEKVWPNDRLVFHDRLKDLPFESEDHISDSYLPQPRSAWVDGSRSQHLINDHDEERSRSPVGGRATTRAAETTGWITKAAEEVAAAL